MSDRRHTQARDEISAYYRRVDEGHRLRESARGVLEFERTTDILRRHLPAAPARVLDVGGGPGAYARWLDQAGYQVHLIDVVPEHLQSQRVGASGVQRTAADARALPVAGASVDVVLLLGPLYHLLESDERRMCWREATRVVGPGGIIVGAYISRYASLWDCLTRAGVSDEEFRRIALNDVRTGVHLNPARRPDLFTTAYFHHPEEAINECESAGLTVQAVLAVEGPGWLVPDLERCLEDQRTLEALLEVLREIEQERGLVGASAHVVLIASKGNR